MLSATPSITTDRRRPPPLWIDLAYGSVGLAATLPWVIVDSWLLFFFLPPGEAGARVPIALYGVPVAAASFANVILCPIVGHLSDQMRSRWGRRRPFIGAGALLLLASFGLLWRPPVAGSSVLNLVYLGLILAAYNVGYVLIEVPFIAFLPELARSDSHRVRLATILAAAQGLGVLLAALAGPLIQLFGYESMAWLYAAIALPFFVWPMPVLREYLRHQMAPVDRPGFGAGLVLTAHNRSFLMLVGAGLCSGLALAFTVLIMPFLVTEICAARPADSAWFYAVAVVTSLACYPAVTRLSERLGKKRVMAGALGLSAVAFSGLALIGTWWPVPLLAQGIAWVALESAVSAPVNVLPPAFIADITDEDTRRTGRRREGAFSSVWVLQNQFVPGMAALVAPVILLLGRSHLDPYGPLGVRLVGVVGGVLCGLGCLFMRRYTTPPSSAPRTGPLGRPL